MRETIGADNLVERDYAKKSLTAAEVETIFGNADIASFLNPRHALYKERNFAAQLPPRAELIQLILAEPNLLRRPIVRKDNNVVIGFDQTALKVLDG